MIIIGGGDTAADCLGTCHRQQARSVIQLDYNPRPPEGENPETPWPLWPKILRITPAHEEGGKRDWQIKTKAFVGDDRGRVKELHAVRVHQYFDEAGERQFEEIHGSELIFPCELVLLAIGFSGPEPGLVEALGLSPDRAGRDPLQPPVHDQPAGHLRGGRLPQGPVAGRLGDRRGPRGGPAHRPVPDRQAQRAACPGPLASGGRVRAAGRSRILRSEGDRDVPQSVASDPVRQSQTQVMSDLDVEHPLFRDYALNPKAWDELFAGPGRPHDYCRLLVDRLGGSTPASSSTGGRSADLAFINQGITFSVYSDRRGVEKIFPFDLIPRPVSGQRVGPARGGPASSASRP